MVDWGGLGVLCGKVLVQVQKGRGSKDLALRQQGLVIKGLDEV